MSKTSKTVEQQISKTMTDLILESTITCPDCGHAEREIMPTDACQFFYECVGCHTLLRPKSGHCCVFCSYGTAVCPPMQSDTSCCGRDAEVVQNAKCVSDGSTRK